MWRMLYHPAIILLIPVMAATLFGSMISGVVPEAGTNWPTVIAGLIKLSLVAGGIMGVLYNLGAAWRFRITPTTDFSYLAELSDGEYLELQEWIRSGAPDEQTVKRLGRKS